MKHQILSQHFLKRIVIVFCAILSLLAWFDRAVYADNPGTGKTSQGQDLNIFIDESPKKAVQVQGQSFIVNGTTAIGTLQSQANVLYIVDVSGSTSSPINQDCNGSGVVDAADDFNSDSSAGDTLDCEISGILALNQSLTNNSAVSGGLVLFGSLAAVADVDPSDGEQSFTSPLNADLNGNGNPDLAEVARSLDTGSIDLFSSKSVGGGTSFNNAIASINQAFTSAGAGNNIAFFLSDGESSINTGENSPLAQAKTAGTVIHTYSVGTSSTGCAETESLQIIADQTGGICTEVMDPTQLRVALPGTTPADIDRVEVVAGASGVLTTTLDVLGNWSTVIPVQADEFPLTITATVYATDGTAVSADIVIDPLAPTDLDAVEEPTLPIKVYLPSIMAQ